MRCKSGKILHILQNQVGAVTAEVLQPFGHLHGDQLGRLMSVQAEGDVAGDPGRRRPQAVEVTEEVHGQPNTEEPLAKEGEGGENGDRRQVEI